MRLGSGILFGGLAVAATSYPVIQEMREAKQEHKSVLLAGTKSIIRNNWQYVVSLGTKSPGVTMTALALIPATAIIAPIAYNYYRVHSDYLREAGTPFSHRYEMSDNAWRLQQQALQSLSGARSLISSEAGAYARRYFRS